MRHAKVQASVMEAHIAGYEKNGLHADFGQYDVDGFAVEDETEPDVTGSECVVSRESAACSVAQHC